MLVTRQEAQMQTERARANVAKNIDRLSVGVFIGFHDREIARTRRERERQREREREGQQQRADAAIAEKTLTEMFSVIYMLDVKC